jgi:hypothetical protein
MVAPLALDGLFFDMPETGMCAKGLMTTIFIHQFVRLPAGLSCHATTKTLPKTPKSIREETGQGSSL